MLNGPMYETKADAINTSPRMTSSSADVDIIDADQRSPSAPRAFTSLVASPSFFSHLAAVSSASFFL